MPSRILREGIVTSEAVNSLTHLAEIFYRRLMSVADDYGRYYAHPSLLRGACFALQLDIVSEADVKRVLIECESKGLLTVYGEGRRHVQIEKFRQQTRSSSKFPKPPDNELLIKCEANVKRMCSDSDSDSDSDSKSDSKSGPGKVYSPQSRAALAWLNESTGKHFRESNTSLAPIDARLREPGVDIEGVKKMISRQCERWKGTAQEEYLTPSTLFGPEKFNNYYASKDLKVNHENAKSVNPRLVGVYKTTTDYSAVVAKRMAQQMAPDADSPPKT